MFDILYASDANYFEFMLTSIYSLLENNKNLVLNIHIIDGGFTDYQKKKLNKLLYMYDVDFKIYPIDIIRKYLDKFDIPLWRGTEVSNARLFASEFIKNTNQVLYIDSDTIVDGPIEYAFYSNDRYPVMAVEELARPSYTKDKLDTYYNSGVLLYDFDLWDKDHALDKILKTSKDFKGLLVYPDQDLLNYALNGSIGDISFNYNISPKVYDISNYSKIYQKSENLSSKCVEQVIEDLKNPCIYHMLSFMNIRPWQKNKIHPFNEKLDEYLYEVYPYFKKEDANNFLSTLSFMPELNRFTKAVIPGKLNQKVRSKVKKVLNMNEL